MKAVLYPRVSTEEQFKEGYSLQAQIDKMKAFCYSQGWEVTKIYSEEGKSAKDLKRPKLQQLLSELDQFDVVLVYKLDRLSRSVADINYLLQTFEKNNVAFKSATEAYDTTTSQGKLLINIFASLAQFEREQLAERTQFGMMRRHEEGQRNGGRAPFGYELNDESKLIVVEEEAKWVRWMFDNFFSKGKRVIAKELNEKGVRTRSGKLWEPSSVDYVVNNPVYIGELRWNYRTKQGNRTYEEVTIPSKHEPIIDKETFNEIKKQRRNRKQTGYSGKSVYPFSGILTCHRCGYKLNGEKRKRADGSIYRFYKCVGRTKYGVCDMPVIGEDTIEKEFLKVIELYSDENLEVPDESLDISDVEKELKHIRKRMENLKEMRVDGDLSKKEFREKMDKEQEKENDLLKVIESYQNQTSTKIDELLETVKEEWTNLSDHDKKKFIHSIFENFVIDAHGSHTGGKGQRVPIEFIDYAYK